MPKAMLRSSIFTSGMTVELETSVTHEPQSNKMPNCPDDYKELSKRSGKAHTTRIKPGPSHDRVIIKQKRIANVPLIRLKIFPVLLHKRKIRTIGLVLNCVV